MKHFLAISMLLLSCICCGQTYLWDIYTPHFIKDNLVKSITHFDSDSKTKPAEPSMKVEFDKQGRISVKTIFQFGENEHDRVYRYYYINDDVVPDSCTLTEGPKHQLEYKREIVESSPTALEYRVPLGGDIFQQVNCEFDSTGLMTLELSYASGSQIATHIEYHSKYFLKSYRTKKNGLDYELTTRFKRRSLLKCTISEAFGTTTIAFKANTQKSVQKVKETTVLNDSFIGGKKVKVKSYYFYTYEFY